MCSLDLQSRIDSNGHVPNFSSNILAFTITIRPYVQHIRSSGLSLDILFDGLFVIRNELFDWCLEQLGWIELSPVLVASWEVLANEVAGNAGERDGAVAPWRPERVVEVVVFQVLASTNTLLQVMLA
jgi:hypothetical protein